MGDFLSVCVGEIERDVTASTERSGILETCALVNNHMLHRKNTCEARAHAHAHTRTHTLLWAGSMFLNLISAQYSDSMADMSGV